MQLPLPGHWLFAWELEVAFSSFWPAGRDQAETQGSKSQSAPLSVVLFFSCASSVLVTSLLISPHVPLNFPSALTVLRVVQAPEVPRGWDLGTRKGQRQMSTSSNTLGPL